MWCLKSLHVNVSVQFKDLGCLENYSSTIDDMSDWVVLWNSEGGSKIIPGGIKHNHLISLLKIYTEVVKEIFEMFLNFF